MRVFCLFAASLASSQAQSLDLGPLTAAETQRAGQPLEIQGRRLPRTGVHRSLTGGARTAWTQISDGRHQLTIRSRGAAGLRLHITGFDAGAGTLTVRGASSDPVQTYTAQGPFADGDFWTQTVFSDEVTLSYQGERPVHFDLPEISHSLPGGLFRAANSQDTSPLRCMRDVSCSAEWLETARSVANYLFEVEGGQASCTGALVKTKSNSGTPYFATAWHCVADEQTARTVEAYWQYQTAKCNGPVPPLAASDRSSPAGARYVVAKDTTAGDFSLLVLNSFPPSARFANWDPRDPDLGTPIIGIHHPAGTQKRISFGEIFVKYWSINDGTFPSELYHQVRWNEGATYYGSSGSPLFTKDGSVIGMLSHGPDFSGVDICAQNPKVDGYAKFSNAWPSFRPYLDDPPPSSLTVTPEALKIVVDNGIVAPASRQTLVISTTSADALPVSVRASDRWVEVNRRAGQVKAGAPFTTEIQLLPEFLLQPGAARARLEVISGTNGRPIPVDAEVVIRPSDVELTVKTRIDANANTDCRYSASIALRERAGVSTAVNGLRINGDDFTGKVADWFGSNLLNANQTLQTTLQVCWPSTPTPYTFLVSGRDVFSGRTWTQSTTVEFR